MKPYRVIAVHDPKMRHGRKSAKRFDGHKGAIAGDPESQLITAVAVLPGNAQDHEQVLALVKQTDTNADIVVEETVGDCAFGESETQQTFAEANRKQVAKVPRRQGNGTFRKSLFALTCVCPAEQVCRTVVGTGSGKRYRAPNYLLA